MKKTVWNRNIERLKRSRVTTYFDEVPIGTTFLHEGIARTALYVKTDTETARLFGTRKHFRFDRETSVVVPASQAKQYKILASKFGLLCDPIRLWDHPR